MGRMDGTASGREYPVDPCQMPWLWTSGAGPGADRPFMAPSIATVA
jgi:hypothetical protein